MSGYDKLPGYNGGYPANQATPYAPNTPYQGASGQPSYMNYPNHGPEHAVNTPTFKGEVPAQDIRPDMNAAEPTPSAPPPNLFDRPPPGYEECCFGSASPLQPPQVSMPVGPPPERSFQASQGYMTAEEAREVLLEHAANKCCWGTGPAEDMRIVGISNSDAFHYTLETFTEARSTSWAYEPFMGQPVDGSNNGPAPGPWDVPIQFPEKFRDNSTSLEVPHTASIKPCHECATIGRIRCYRCHGRGRVICHHCDGSGRETYYEDGTNHQRSCTWCHGSGRNRCAICFGHGQVPCKTCEAKGQLKCYIKLTVEWTNHVADHIVERTALPDKLIKRVSGQVAFEEELPRVWPINHFPDEAINKASNDLVNQHTTSFPSERIIVQRQRVRIVPVAETSFIYKDKPARNFYIYGLEKKVHAPDYPATCCWGGCTII